MPNVQAVQILEDGPVNTSVKLTGVLDGTDPEAYNVKLLPATFNTEFGLKYTLPETWRVDFVEFAMSDGLQAVLYWDVGGVQASSVVMLPLAGRGNKSFKNFGGLTNNAREIAGYTGGIGLEVGYNSTFPASTLVVYSIILDLTKQGRSLS